MSFDPFAAQKRAIDRFAANEKFFAQTELDKYLKKPNERLTLHISPNGFNVKEGDRLAFDTNIFEFAEKLAFNPLANELYKPIVIQDFAKAKTDINPITSQGVNKILNLAQNDADFTANEAHFDEKAPLPPIVFYGAFGGAHIALLDENDRLSNGAIIYESDAEWFVISCFFLDYSRFLDPAKANLLIVGGKMRVDLAYSFFAVDRFSRGFIRLDLALDNRAENADAMKQIAIAHKESLRGWGTSEDELIGVKNAIANRAKPRLNKANKIDCAIAVVGAGASLDKLTDFLLENQSKLIIFSAGTALKPLLKAGIKPDFHIEIERMDHLAAILREAPIGDIPLIAADLVDPSTLETAKESFVFSRDSSAASAFSQKRIAFSSPIVGNAALALALEFASEIYLCGLDVGFRRDRKMHAYGSFYDDKNDESVEQIPTRGVFSDDIWTNSLLSHSRAALEMAIGSKPNAKVFNLSDGAFIAFAKPLRSHEANVKNADKSKAIAAIKSSFTPSKNAPQIDLSQELNEAKQALIITLKNFLPQNKRELFLAAKAALKKSVELEQTLRFGAPFLRGSFWHITNALIKSLLCVKRSDISDLYKSGANTIADVLDRLCDLCLQELNDKKV
ncbi:MAG: DUF115 domain-containing protein [Helicobacteraceae bacterium]|jgi:hypothetical protein|nr:DUF115 domain-containing protein [Helicobacteraceae bacterium]